ncbi:hypothetical protein ABZX90_35870 [Streptomyces sp. NPDC002935]|uniref:hypothetical protein n=1 Tax=unclassified Streptomyces TaxID=2593676 RepID=UPI0033233CA7
MSWRAWLPLISASPSAKRTDPRFVYLADDHVTGYLDADLKGKVTRVMPAQD